jgi:hypothetical protein
MNILSCGCEVYELEPKVSFVKHNCSYHANLVDYPNQMYLASCGCMLVFPKVKDKNWFEKPCTLHEESYAKYEAIYNEYKNKINALCEERDKLLDDISKNCPLLDL